MPRYALCISAIPMWRGHIYPYVVRKLLEEDFGGDAVLDMKVTYGSSGLAHETGAPGIVYHILGVNGKHLFYLLHSRKHP